MSGETDTAVATVPSLVERRAETVGDETFLVQAETGDSLTYEEIDRASDEVAATVDAHGVEFGKSVALVMDNTAPAVVSLFGVQKTGAVPVPINPEYTPREVRFILETSNCSAVITEDPHEETVDEATEGLDVGPVLTAGRDGERNYRRESGRDFTSSPAIDGDSTALILFTSGTTGDPKGVVITHRHLLGRCKGAQRSHSNLLEWDPPGVTTDVCYTVLPLYNIDGVWTTISAMWSEGVNVLRDGFSASAFWEDVETYGANLTSVVPSVLAILRKRGYPDDLDVSSFELFVVSGSHLPEDLAEAFESEFDVDVVEIYGLTEAAGTGYTSDYEAERKLGSCGYAHGFAELSVVDEETGEHLDPGEMGEIVIRGEAVFDEYYENPEQTDEAFENGWFHTGDIGYRDDQDRYYVMDRIKDIIIRGGQNIYPGEIEEVLLTHERVEDAAVVGADHEIYGETVAGYVVADDSGLEDLPETLRRYCGEQLADYKVPADVEILDEFPRGETGKILKEELD